MSNSGPHRPGPHRIVFANEKGGTGKSTTAVHVAIALAYSGKRVAAIDLDHRQRTFARYLENRAETCARREVELPSAEFATFEGDIEGLEAKVAELAAGDLAGPVDYIVFDTPGRDDPLARHAASKADTLVTPMNDSFVDFDLIGQVDAETFKVRRLSFYAELIFEARKTRAMKERREMDWIVVRNRVQHIDARNQKRVDQALTELSKRVGFRVAQGLSERVIYRELFPSGLTLLDKGHLGELGTSHLVARQELRQLIAALHLPGLSGAAPAKAA
ncbi:division plane positioning ATPase MipZ [Tsuneonella sp. HG222]